VHVTAAGACDVTGHCDVIGVSDHCQLFTCTAPNALTTQQPN